MPAAPQPPAGKPGTAAPLAVALVVLAVAWFFGEIRTRTGWDDTYYLLQTSSLAEDGDLDLRNDAMDWRLAPRELLVFLTSTLPSGSLKNTFSVGPAVMWLPAYAAGAVWPGHAARWTQAQLVALHLLSLALLAGTAWFLYALMAAAGGAVPRMATTTLAATAALILGTPLAVYGSAAYTMAHLPSAAAACLLVAALLWLEREPRWDRALLAGAALGLVFLVRWQDAVFVLLFWAPLAKLWRASRGRRRLAPLLAVLIAAGAGGLAAASLQLQAWHLEAGSWLTMPQGGQYMRWWQPHLSDFLFSGFNGLLPWSPVFALAAAGLLLPWRCRLSPAWRPAALAVLASEVYLNAAVHDWWGGTSFGSRRMTSCLPLLAIGLANLAANAAAIPTPRGRRAPALLALALGALCLWGCFTTNLYWQQVPDLSLVLRGAPSAGAAEAPPENRGIADPAAARRLALRPAGRRQHDDFDDTQGAGLRGGWAVTLALMAATIAGTCLLLSRVPHRRLVPALLLASLALILWSHARLALGPHPDPAERAAWQRCVEATRAPPDRHAAQAAASTPPATPAAASVTPASPPDQLPRGHPPAEPGQPGLADAYRYLAMVADLRSGPSGMAPRLLDHLVAGGYPAAIELRRQIASVDGSTAARPVRLVFGTFCEPRPGNPGCVVQLPAAAAASPASPASPASNARNAGDADTANPGGSADSAGGADSQALRSGPLDLVFDLRLAADESLEDGAVYDVLALRDAAWTDLARLSLRGGRTASGTATLLLATPLQLTTADLVLPPDGALHVHGRLDAARSLATFTVEAAPGTGASGGTAWLTAPLAAGAGPPATLLFGRTRKKPLSFPLSSAAFSDLWVVAGGPPPRAAPASSPPR